MTSSGETSRILTLLLQYCVCVCVCVYVCVCVCVCVFRNENEVWFGHITLLLNVVMFCYCLWVVCRGRNTETQIDRRLYSIYSSTRVDSAQRHSRACCHSFEHGKVSAGVTEHRLTSKRRTVQELTLLAG